MPDPSKSLIVPATGEALIVAGDLQKTADRAAELVQARNSVNTRRAYASDWAAFSGFAASLGKEPAPAAPELVVLYLTRLVEEGLRYATIERALAGITFYQRQFDPLWMRNDPAIQAVMKGARRELGTASEAKDALDDDRLREVVVRRPPTRRGTLEKAVLLLGWASALRRSSIVSLNVEDVRFVRIRRTEAQGLEITVRREKNDQNGQGRLVGIEPAKDLQLCPVRALDAWLTVCGRPKSGPLFRLVFLNDDRLTDRRLRAETVADFVKAAVEEVGLSPETFAGHSLRRGFATTAAAAGVGLDAIQRQTGHKSLKTLIEHYIKPATVFTDNATKGLL